MARKQPKQRNTDLPGSFYQRNSRWWWKIQLPGEEKAKNRPLKPIGAKYAATDHSVACEVARNLWQQAVYRQNPKDTQIAVSNIASLIAAYLKHCDAYYLDETGKPTKEVQEVRYTLTGTPRSRPNWMTLSASPRPTTKRSSAKMDSLLSSTKNIYFE